MLGTAKSKPARGTAKRQKHAAKRRQAKADKAVYAAVIARDGHKCRVCRVFRADVQRHHITPRSLGGPTTTANVVTLCPECHLVGVHGGRIKLAGNANEKLTITAATTGGGAANGWAIWESVA